MTSKKSTPIIKEIKDYIKEKTQYRCERINAGKIPVGRWWMTLANDGHPDMVFYLPRATLLFVEIKAPWDTISTKQEEYRDYILKCGFEYLIAESFQDVHQWLVSHEFVFDES